MSDYQGISRQRCRHGLSENGTIREHPVPKFGGLLRLSRICPRASGGLWPGPPSARDLLCRKCSEKDSGQSGVPTWCFSHI